MNCTLLLLYIALLLLVVSGVASVIAVSVTCKSALLACVVVVVLIIVLSFCLTSIYHARAHHNTLQRIHDIQGGFAPAAANGNGKIGIVIVATNAYFPLGLRLIKQWLHYADDAQRYVFYFFSDTDIHPYMPDKNHHQVVWVETSHKSWQDATNSKFNNILSIKQQLMRDCEYVFYFDADTSISQRFNSGWFLLGDLVGGEHFINNYPQEKPYDRNPESAAYIPTETPFNQTYYYGAFFGGHVLNVLALCNTMTAWQQKNKLIDFEPVWNDESYLNKYFHYLKPQVVPTDKFMFNISDKNGITGDNRAANSDWKKTQRDKLLMNKDLLLNIF